MKILNFVFKLNDKSRASLSTVLFTAICFMIIFSTASLYGNDLLQLKGLSNVNGLAKRQVHAKPFHTVVGNDVYRDLIIVKFGEGSDIRLRNGQLTKDIGQLHKILAKYKLNNISRLFSRTEQEVGV